MSFDAYVNAIKVRQNTVYVGGFFTQVNSTTRYRITSWTGDTSGVNAWTDYTADTSFNNAVNAIEFDNSDNLYAGGSFTHPYNYIARWNGTSWLDLSGLNGIVNDIKYNSIDDNLYVGGQLSFADQDGSQIQHITRWDGTRWYSLNFPLGGGTVYSVAFDSSNILYVGGSFSSNGNIARYVDNSWNFIYTSTGPSNFVYTIDIDSNDNLYAGGAFTNIGTRIAVWNGSSWSNVGTGVNSTVNNIHIDNSDNVYATGYFTTAGGNSANRIAVWNGTSWASVGNGLGNSDGKKIVKDSNDNIYVGRGFTIDGDGSDLRYFGVLPAGETVFQEWDTSDSGFSIGDPHITTLNGDSYDLDVEGFVRYFDNNNVNDRLVINAKIGYNKHPRWNKNKYIKKWCILVDNQEIYIKSGFRGKKVELLTDIKNNDKIKVIKKKLQFNDNAFYYCPECKFKREINKKNKHKIKTDHKYLKHVRNEIKLIITLDKIYILKFTNVDKYNLQPAQINMKISDYVNLEEYSGAIVSKEWADKCKIDGLNNFENIK